jgi:hypothetical protein
MYDNLLVKEAFLESLNSQEGTEKVAEAGSTFIRTKLREAGFARRIMIPEFVTYGELYRDENFDQHYKLKDIEPDSAAMPVTLRGRADYEYITGRRYRINFFPLETKRYEKKEDELMAYEMPITKLIEQNSIKDLQKIEDGRLITHCDAAVLKSGNSATSAYVAGTHGNHIPKNILTKLANLFTDKQLELEYILMNKKDFASIYLWEDLGSALSFEVIPGGYKYETLNGIKIVTTNKSDIVPAGTIYGFTNQNFFGDFLVLSDVKFYVKKEYDMISFFAKQNIGMSIGNVNGVAKCTLTGTL